jgi:hypothetical protein
VILEDEDYGLKVSINMKISSLRVKPYPNMVDLVVRCSVSSHDQQGNVGNDIEHYEDNFE